jgi:hypothetical protein
VFVPYWRFKGLRYTCTHAGVSHRFLDISALALEGSFPSLPISLGVRSQALPLKQITPKTSGRFLRPADRTIVLDQAQQRSRQMNIPSDTGFTEHIGETLSLIYAPFYARNGRLMDAILNRAVGPAADTGPGLTDLPGCRPEKQTRFVPGICPACGWNLEGAADSLILICRNCSTLWKPGKQELSKIHFRCARPGSGTDVMVPFWRIQAHVSGLPLSSMADLTRLANLPRAIAPEWEHQDVFFWSPAFKVRPRIFLSLASRVTLGQPAPNMDRDLDREIRENQHVPVTLPVTEAVQSIRITLAGLAKPRSERLTELTRLEIKPVRATLVFLAFEDQVHDYVHTGLKAGINKNALALAANL